MNLLIYLIAYPSILLISYLPFRILYFLSDITYYLLYYILRYRRKIVRFNLEISKIAKSKKELIVIEKKFYRHITDVFFEMFKFFTISGKEIRRRFVVENPEILDEYAKKNKNVIFMVAHHGGFEYFMSIGYHVPHAPFAVYTPITNKYLDNLVKKIRLNHGAKMISRYNAASFIENQLKENKLFLYGMAADQSAQIRSITYWKEFLGIKVPVFTGSERIAKQHNIPVVFGEMKKVKRGFYKVYVDVISEHPREHKDFEITDIFLKKVEKQIKEYPHLYFWTHNRFKHKDKAPRN
tara:strand:+ start:300 stop:1184 length:885 start_codon:yes stop_codon:yes gene_type:complete